MPSKCLQSPDARLNRGQRPASLLLHRVLVRALSEPRLLAGTLATAFLGPLGGSHGADLFGLSERFVNSKPRRPSGARHGEGRRAERRGSAARGRAAHLRVALRAELWLELRLLLAAVGADVLCTHSRDGARVALHRRVDCVPP